MRNRNGRFQATRAKLTQFEGEADMGNKKRQIQGAQYDVTALVLEAMAAADTQVLDTEAARQSLAYMGRTNPTDEQVARYARETAILAALASRTGANFGNQIGKIDFSSIETAVAGVNSYLNRRNAGHRARWTANHR
uniref:Uncharacterized protein n=2 Tax=viral metagenome TaxID=1070528 RepID=A0A6M3M2M3_9ZZZZ